MTRADYTATQRAYKPPPRAAHDYTKPRYFRVRLVPGGPPTALKIVYGPPADPVTGETLDRSHRWQVWLSGALCEDPTEFIIHFNPDGSPVVKGEEIDALEHKYLLQLHQHARIYDATAPEADPRKPVDRRKLSPILPPR